MFPKEMDGDLLETLARDRSLDLSAAGGTAEKERSTRDPGSSRIAARPFGGEICRDPGAGVGRSLYAIRL